MPAAVLIFYYVLQNIVNVNFKLVLEKNVHFSQIQIKGDSFVAQVTHNQQTLRDFTLLLQ